MKRLICLIIVIMLLLPSCAPMPVAADKDTVVVYSVTEVIDAAYTPPNTYELCYRTTFSNGLIVDRWTTVTREEYERSIIE